MKNKKISKSLFCDKKTNKAYFIDSLNNITAIDGSNFNIIKSQIKHNIKIQCNLREKYEKKAY